jgi:hypothetical protein
VGSIKPGPNHNFLEIDSMEQNRPQWQKNFRKTPETIERKLKRLGSERIVVASAKNIRASELRAGLYSHLELGIDGDTPVIPERVVPAPMTGKYSLWNVEGREIVRRDLPMVTQTFVVETPNFGDWTYGSHEVYIPRDVYQRDFVAPKGLEISMHLLGTEAGEDSTFIIRFRVEHILSTASEDFQADLFAALNLLQENIGQVDVFTADADASEYLKTIRVYWEILPPGERTETITRILSKFREPSDELRSKLAERYALLERLKPIAYISGTSGFHRYFGAQFAENLVVFENLEYGNAIYAMFDNWEELSKLSRLELLNSRRGDFERIVHRSGWETRLIELVRERRRSAA